ncbi:hypothetical protein CSB08_00115 [Candidatus Gracilibacteria bacterium]|nr:MAG: hypothetical protein CSB08_00115 [Candidatus Gracilibacteria bacterium]PIE85688.1 MAG: hypothetical protein CSA08_00625 [Candidatus Gracilibacteria bacterium]
MKKLFFTSLLISCLFYNGVSADTCIQIIQPAKNIKSGECKEFSTPCDVPAGWKNVDKCDSIEDNQIVDKLKGKEKKQLDFDFKLKKFNSCEDMEKVMGDYIKSYWENNKRNYRRDFFLAGDVAFDKVEGIDSETNSLDFGGSEIKSLSKPNISKNSSDDYSETNIQVKGVDESDIIKTDGKYIYYYNESDKYVYISDVDSKEVVKKINIPKNFYNPVLYVSKNRLIILSSGYSKAYYGDSYWINRSQKTYTVIFDTSEISKPKLLKLYINDGNLTKSRKIGKYLYVISNNSFNIPYRVFSDKEDIDVSYQKIIPRSFDVARTSDSEKQNLKIKGKPYPYNIKSGKVAKCNEIEYVLPDEETLKKYSFNPSYNIISIIDTEDTSNEVKTKVIAGSNSEIYMSLDNLYMTNYMYQPYNYSCPINARCIMPFYYGGTTNTLVHKLSVDGQQVNYKTSNIIPGSPLTQYSMDEKDSYFRIITTTNNWNGTNERHTDLYVLDTNLKLAGSLENMGEGENFQSSRFMGDKLFLVTFKQIDPLFAIDLSEVTKPKILGELKIPGYSTYLHPYDENHLIGLGFDTKENRWGGTVNGGLKVDLYEVNYDRKCGDDNLTVEENKKCKSGDYKGIIVKQKYSLTYGDKGSSSEATHNPRMFMWNAKKKMLFVPSKITKKYNDDDYKNKSIKQGLYFISIHKDNGIQKKFMTTHIDLTGLEEERIKECSKYTGKKSEPKCVKIIGGGEYCKPSSDYRYVPEYCYESATVEEYFASKYWRYRNEFIKRGLWIGNNVYSISNKKISINDMDTFEEKGEIEFK